VEKAVPNLTGVPETMLWTLHNRACEARRPDGVLRDPEAVRIYEAIDYDYVRSFGQPEGTHAVRSAQVDRVLRRWLQDHPDGFVVSLGEGLETAAQRLDNGRLRWLSVDVPEAIRVRERFLQPTGRLRHLALSALDRRWMDEVDPGQGVFILAQGLLMYFPPDEVQGLLVDVADRFPGAEMLFDTIPRWFSRKTVAGLQRTRHYRLPPMPWGIDQDQIAPVLRSWHPRLSRVELIPFMFSRGLAYWLARAWMAVPALKRRSPTLVHARVSA
jgi:O-methyltransferase involved in polyketide biosynthesis